MAERRAHQSQQGIKDAKPDQRSDDIIGQRIVEAERADAAALQAAQAVLAAGDFAPAERGRVGERGERERQQREIDAATAQDDETDDRGRDGDHDHRDQQWQPDLAGKPVQLHQARGIGADPEPCAVAEGDKAGIADAEIEAHRRNRERHHHDAGVERQPAGAQCERQYDHADRRKQKRPVLRGGRKSHSNFSMRSPSSPRGRTRSTRNIRM